MTFGTRRWWGCQPHAPAAFASRKCSWYSFSLGTESTPGPWYGRKEYVTEKSSNTTGNRSLGPSDRNEYQEYFLGGKVGRCVGLTNLPPSCADCHEIWSLNLQEHSEPVQVLFYPHLYPFLNPFLTNQRFDSKSFLQYFVSMEKNRLCAEFPFLKLKGESSLTAWWVVLKHCNITCSAIKWAHILCLFVNAIWTNVYEDCHTYC